MKTVNRANPTTSRVHSCAVVSDFIMTELALCERRHPGSCDGRELATRARRLSRPRLHPSVSYTRRTQRHLANSGYVTRSALQHNAVSLYRSRHGEIARCLCCRLHSHPRCALCILVGLRTGLYRGLFYQGFVYFTFSL